MVVMASPLSVEDALALEAIADLDDDDVLLSEEENEARKKEHDNDDDDSDFIPEDDSLFDFIEDDGDWTSETFVQIGDDIDAPLHHDTQPESNTRESHAFTAPSLPSTAQSNGLKRTASADMAQSTTDDRPPKLTKSFSEGLDEMLGRVSLDTIPDEEAAPLAASRVQPAQVPHDGPAADDLDAQLAVEEEIKNAVANSLTSRSAKMALPDFKIPKAQLEAAIASNKGGTIRTYWSHTLYRGPHGQPVTLLYSRNKEQSEKIAQSMLNEPVVGFDLEWATSGPLKGIKREVSVVQLACEDKTAVFHIALHQGNTVDELFAPSLRRILENPKIIKTGVCAWKADGSRLLRVCGIRCQGIIELSHMHEVAYKDQRDEIGDVLMSLARQTRHVLGLPLEKDNNVRASRWERELNQRQILYAANDAYVGYMLFRHMEARRLWKWPGRRRPEFAELKIKMRQQYNPEELTKSPRRSKTTNQRTSEGAAPGASTASPVKNDPMFEDEREEKLFKALSEHRASVATEHEQSNPARLASDTVLKGIVAARPTDKDALAQVKGIGPTKISAHGEVWLRIVGDHLHLWTTPLPQKPASNGFKVPPMLCAHSPSTPFKTVNSAVESPVHASLFSALQRLRNDLARTDSVRDVPLPSDASLQAIAQARPTRREELGQIPGAVDMAVLTSMSGIDLLAFMRQNVEHHDSKGSANRPTRLDDRERSNDEEDAFETMPDRQRRVSTARWIV